MTVTWKKGKKPKNLTKKKRRGNPEAHLSKPLIIKNLKKRFKLLNPEVGVDMVDWRSAVGKQENFSEALEMVRSEYPEYRWYKRTVDPYDKVRITGIRKEAEELGYVVVSKREANRLHGSALKLVKIKSSKSTHGSHHNPKAKPTKRRVRVFVKEYNRSFPKLTNSRRGKR